MAVLAVGIAAIWISAVGCGGSDASKTVTVIKPTSDKPLSKPEYIARADAICREGNEVSKLFEDRAEEAADRDDAEAAADALEGGVDTIQPRFESLKALEPPAADKELIEDVIADREKAMSLGEQLADALRDGDLQRQEVLAREIETIDERADGVSKGYGFKVCGQGED
jgi:hypothetical protein